MQLTITHHYYISLKMPFPKLQRRHSENVELSAKPKLSFETRRGSVQVDLQGLTQSMSVGLNLLHKKLSRDNFHLVDIDDNLYLDKLIVQKAFLRHSDDQDCKVSLLRFCV